ncbi:MAG: EAL domain-containing protein, partial [Candidatus Omnitrophica bacterium]|nr:EAL domain-containing protein [Candidatus Omnitrophota bacterium]
GRRKAEHELRVLSMAVEQSPASVVITDVDGCIGYVNPQFVKISGYTLAEAKGKKMNIIKSGYMSEKIYEELWRTILSGQEWRGEVYNKKKNGELFWENISISPIKDRDGVITHFVGVQEDITTRKEYERRLIHEAHFDGLTELPNRLLALDRLSQALVRARRKKQMVAVMYIDLDRFKMVNDTLGHPVGDKLLVEAARRLTSSVRESDTVARLGGDEFLIILQDFQGESQRQIVALAQEILGLFSNPFTCEGKEAFVTASIGITIYPDDGDDATVLLRNADAAMYKAKGEERNAFRFFTPGMNQEAIERMEMEYHLRHALEKKEFSLHDQPLVEAKSKKIIGAEALLRWNNPRLGSVPPDRFIPVAEDTGIIIPITDWILEEACREAKGWQEAGEAPSLRIAVNISSRHFVAGDLVRAVSGALKENKLSPEALELEITERLLIENPGKALSVLYELSRIGVRLSLDDFGTGYSALSYLKEFPFQTLKIDRAFIRGITIEKKDVALVRAMIAMSHGMGLKVVGEGVETEPQLELLRSLGCDWIQGYYISKPVPSEQFRRFL